MRGVCQGVLRNTSPTAVEQSIICHDHSHENPAIRLAGGDQIFVLESSREEAALMCVRIIDCDLIRSTTTVK